MSGLKRMLGSVALMAALTGCSSPPAVVPGRDGGQAEAGFSPYGRWRVVSINGTPGRSSSGLDRPPMVTFNVDGYGGSSGCNGFGGLGVWSEGRWYADWAMATQMGCSDVADQEGALLGLLAAGPTIIATGPDTAQVKGADATMTLARMAEPADAPTPQPPRLLAGTRWKIRGVDGTSVHSSSGARGGGTLGFEAETWRAESPCGATEGRWSQSGPDVTMSVTAPAAACAGDPLHEAVQGLARATPRFANGANREFVLGGGGHWLVADSLIEPPDETALRLSGDWRVVRLDEARLDEDERAPRLTFSPHGYRLFNGCNFTEGLALIEERQLFTLGSGLSTLVACPADPRRGRPGDILASAPRVAWTPDGALALVSRAGRMTLVRTDPAPSVAASARPTEGLRAGLSVDLSGVGGRLTLGRDRRFTLVVGCARMAGDWRSGREARFSTEPAQATTPDCDVGPGSAAFRTGQFFNGSIRALIDANGRQVLMVNRGEALAGRIVD